MILIYKIQKSPLSRNHILIILSCTPHVANNEPSGENEMNLGGDARLTAQTDSQIGEKTSAT